jgi:hypothetical protein
MDGDPAVEPELDSFSLTLPLPYRVALIIVLGMVSCDESVIGEVWRAIADL